MQDFSNSALPLSASPAMAAEASPTAIHNPVIVTPILCRIMIPSFRLHQQK
jgi:hypothetical protein